MHHAGRPWSNPYTTPVAHPRSGSQGVRVQVRCDRSVGAADGDATCVEELWDRARSDEVARADDHDRRLVCVDRFVDSLGPRSISCDDKYVEQLGIRANVFVSSVSSVSDPRSHDDSVPHEVLCAPSRICAASHGRVDSSATRSTSSCSQAAARRCASRSSSPADNGSTKGRGEHAAEGTPARRSVGTRAIPIDSLTARPRSLDPTLSRSNPETIRTAAPLNARVPRDATPAHHSPDQHRTPERLRPPSAPRSSSTCSPGVQWCAPADGTVVV